ncbi:MAG: YlxR family protein [Alphaproteobacteria bacterium]|nr:YlxR family protein [Alphaproteobacteria bacterium]
MVEKRRAAPRRRCLAAVDRESHDKSKLLRWRIGAESGRLEFDPGHKLSGRGFYLMPNPEIIAQAVRKNLFARAARRNVVLPRDVSLFEAEIVHGLEFYALTLLRAAKRGRILKRAGQATPSGAITGQNLVKKQKDCSQESHEKIEIGITLSHELHLNKEAARERENAKNQFTYLIDLSPLRMNGQDQELVAQLLGIAQGNSMGVSQGNGQGATPPNAVAMEVSLPNPAQGLAARLQIVLEQLKCLRT